MDNKLISFINPCYSEEESIEMLCKRKGFSITEIKVTHNQRKYGKSKYGMERYLRGFFDSLTVAYLGKYYDKPMHFFGRLGLISGFIGIIICIYLTIIWIMGTSIGNRPLIMLGILLILVGIQFFSMGLIGDILIDRGFKSFYDESHIKEKI